MRHRFTFVLLRVIRPSRSWDAVARNAAGVLAGLVQAGATGADPRQPRAMSDGELPINAGMVPPYTPEFDGIASGNAEIVRHILRPDSRSVHLILSPSPVAVTRLIRLLHSVRPNPFHAQLAIPALRAGALPAVISAGIAQRRYGTRLVVTLHEDCREVVLPGRVGLAVHAGLVRIVDVIVVHAATARTILFGRCGADAARVTCCRTWL